METKLLVKAVARFLSGLILAIVSLDAAGAWIRYFLCDHAVIYPQGIRLPDPDDYDLDE